MSVIFEQGDEIVVSRRHRFIYKDNETNEEIEKVEMMEVSAVRVPDRFICGGKGGSCQPEYTADPENEARDRRFLVIRLPMRY
jgi:hypothetical protein